MRNFFHANFSARATQRLFDYDASGNMIYEGLSYKGMLTTDSVWTIWKMTYNTSNQLTKEEEGHSLAWDSRTTSF